MFVGQSPIYRFPSSDSFGLGAFVMEGRSSPSGQKPCDGVQYIAGAFTLLCNPLATVLPHPDGWGAMWVRASGRLAIGKIPIGKIPTASTGIRTPVCVSAGGHATTTLTTHPNRMPYACSKPD